MAACVIGHISVKDPVKWQDYRGKVPATLTRWGGEVLLRGRRVAALSGQHAHTDVVVIRFPDTRAATGWHASSDYQALIPLREAAADVVLILYEC